MLAASPSSGPRGSPIRFRSYAASFYRVDLPNPAHGRLPFDDDLTNNLLTAPNSPPTDRRPNIRICSATWRLHDRSGERTRNSGRTDEKHRPDRRSY